MKVIATTPDPEIFVIQYDGTLDCQLMRKRHIPYEALSEVTARASGRYGSRYGYYQAEHFTVAQTENPAWTYTQPDCFAIAYDGSEHEMQTQKQLKAFCKTGVVEETAKQRKTRERQAFWASFKNEQEETASDAS